MLLKEWLNGGNTVYHFKDMDKASVNSQKALLKITEEPIPGNYIIINGGPQLKTLESRAKKIVMNPYTLKEVLDFMNSYKLYGDKDSEEYKPNIELQKKLYESGIDSPAKAYYYKDYDKIEAIADFAKTIADEITYLPYDDILWIMSRFETQINKNESKLDVFLLFLNLLM